MTEQSWNVPVVELEENKLVVDLGGGHLVDLVDLINKIKLHRIEDYGGKTVISFQDTVKLMRDHDLVRPNMVQAVKDRRITCNLPLTQVRRGGRPIKSRRPPRRRRATRRTTRRRRV